MKMNVSAKRLEGVMTAVSSKSDAHRAVICASLCDGSTEIRLGEYSDDVTATVECLCAMGAKAERTEYGFRFTKSCDGEGASLLNCRESGSTLRFLLPIAAALGGRKTFSGAGRLPQRPLIPLIEALEGHNVVFDNKKLPLVSAGKLSGGSFTLPGNISSQFISGLLFAVPLTGDGGSITVTDGLQSAGYVDMTLRSLDSFGVHWKKQGNEYYTISPDQRYTSPGVYNVEGDWSGAAFFLVAAAINGDITVKGLTPESAQSDRAVLDILKEFGARTECSADTVRITSDKARPINVDVSDCPDLFPCLSVLACRAEGVSRLYNASRLRLKESDRVATTADMLRALGVLVKEEHDALEIHGTGSVCGGIVNGASDHRIVMSASIASLMCAGSERASIMVTDAEAISKSYPSFFRDLTACGGKCAAF